MNNIRHWVFKHITVVELNFCVLFVGIVVGIIFQQLSFAYKNLYLTHYRNTFDGKVPSKQ